MKTLLSLFLGLTLLAGCSSSSEMEMDANAGVMVGGSMMLPTQNLVQNASGASNLTTLVAAVTAADLGATLSGPGPFTVFAPPNSAFAALPAGTVDNLLKAENKAQLTAVLTYHVVPGRLSAADLRDGQMLTTVNGAQLQVRKMDGKVMVGGATVTQANVYASNGVAHVIDKVLLP
ncbi:fasciclin domain-containing protein [Rubricoccus marinus]|uniref:FAS1 domain-containing protein n=1 Tax=Rubricoccus marinus TaxID=716817 RepID=A0A259TYQ5_9BACT|nr:fasciclin domain-containing protein [Rubricoccus marinus]OZC02826.1 hypothetical protein BSZ36_07475 [Rubricoccus marinus]